MNIKLSQHQTKYFLGWASQSLTPGFTPINLFPHPPVSPPPVHPVQLYAQPTFINLNNCSKPGYISQSQLLHPFSKPCLL